MDSALQMYRRTNPLGPVDYKKLIQCSIRVVSQRDKQLCYRAMLLQELKHHPLK